MELPIDNETLIGALEEIVNNLKKRNKDIEHIKIASERGDGKAHVLIDLTFQTKNDFKNFTLETGQTIKIEI
ncbi:hypothetical protein EFN43_08370 [Pediococcus pentosaceus]|uniref:hypothetical protein n=1 Tax=Pediococcus pentosaceus TaxID=1255 RepID=UPI0021A864A1|nr:hypothetical protein [Pediococcus pentosaceus]MCT3021071.1 hypothetical protein [Pediococcus pentosaceus]